MLAPARFEGSSPKTIAAAFDAGTRISIASSLGTRDQNQFRHHIGTTYIAVDSDGFIAGFATVTASEIALESLPGRRRKGLPRYPIPVLRLARLATDERAKGRGVGRLLLRAVIRLARQMSRDVGCAGIIVDAKPNAALFYEKLGFFALESLAGQLGDRREPLPMFLEVGRVTNNT